jgi:hypothetical protein
VKSNRFLFYLSLLFFLIFHICPADAQEVPFSSDRWDIAGEDYQITDYKGQETLVLKGGIAYLKDVDFLNGTIEFDIAIPEERGFMGAVWRLQDRKNYEEFYLRPHQSGNPDANQYTPVFHGLASWQLYHGEGYGQPVSYSFDEWMHVKIVINGQAGEVYINNMEEPVVTIHDMKRDLRSGRIGIEAGNFAPGRFANFKYTLGDSPELKSRIKPPVDPVYGTVLNWEVSNPFPLDLVKDKRVIETRFVNDKQWTEIESENTGITNLARLFDLSKGNTVMVRLLIDSNEDQMKGFQLGYSDIAQVYINNLILYTGENTYQSRDYRYLGTIGYFDVVYLPLQRGINELIITVTENFGGWGIMGKFTDTNGIAY